VPMQLPQGHYLRGVRTFCNDGSSCQPPFDLQAALRPDKAILYILRFGRFHGASKRGCSNIDDGQEKN
jgi:hypothetical protein